MKSTDDCILRVIIGLSRYFDKFYCFPAQQTIIRKIYEYDGVLISSATLNRHLDNLEADGFFTRTRRYDQRTREFRSTLYKLLPLAFSYLKRMGSFLKSVGGNVFDFLKADKKKARSFNQASNAFNFKDLTIEEQRAREIARDIEDRQSQLDPTEQKQNLAILGTFFPGLRTSS